MGTSMETPRETVWTAGGIESNSAWIAAATVSKIAWTTEAIGLRIV